MTVIARPPFQLRSLPIPMRWEVTRRNPYYVTMWKSARAVHRREIIVSNDDDLIRQAALPTLSLIGVSGEPPDPATEFESLGADELHQGWLSGAVHPVTLRGLAALLIAALPKSTLGDLGRVCATAAVPDNEEQSPKRFEALQQLATLTSAGLDDYVDEPIVSINPAASERKIGEAIDQLLRDWKTERDLKERRNRSDKYANNLQVWDLREGWHAGVYDRQTEHTFQEIADITRRTIPTLNNQYCRAFELIVGVPFSREKWLQTMGPIKHFEILGAGPARTRRPTTSPTRRPIPETTLWAPGRNEELPTLTQNVAADTDFDFCQLLTDIETMFRLGRSDEQIAAELDLSVEAISNLRSRGDMALLGPQEDA